MNEQILCEQIAPSPPIEVHMIVQTMTNFMNYLYVSLYEGQFTKNHEDSYSILHSIYDSVASRPSTPPPLVDCESFYSNIVTTTLLFVEKELCVVSVRSSSYYIAPLIT